MVDLSSKSLAFARVAGEPVDLLSIEGHVEAIPPTTQSLRFPNCWLFDSPSTERGLWVGSRWCRLAGRGLRGGGHCGFHYGIPTSTRGPAQKGAVGHDLAGALGNLWIVSCTTQYGTCFCFFPA